jgi:hypothetical protein
MALQALSLITYGLEVTSLNANIDFKNASLGPTLTAVLPLGFYSPASLATAVVSALQSLDSTNVYSIVISRNILGGTQNRFTIATTGSYLSLLFGTGPHITTSAASLMGFNPVDYLGNTSYTGSQTVGTALIPSFLGYNYLDDRNQRKVFGAVNVAASGLKTAVVFNIQSFIDVQFKYEPLARLLEWDVFFNWAIQQRDFDFTPEITSPNTVFQVNLEKTSYDGKGLGFQMKEMLPNFPNLYDTGVMNFRIVPQSSGFLAP